MLRNQDTALPTFGPSAPPKTGGTWFIAVFGVILPCVAIGVEANLHLCAQMFFDPLPSLSHVFLFSLIPAANLLVLLSRGGRLGAYYASTTLLSGMAMGVAVLYTLMFLPILPLSFVAVLAMGLGFLGLAPVISILTLKKSGSMLVNLAKWQGTYFDPHLVKHLGHVVVLATVVAVEMPSTLTRVYLSMASQPRTQLQGVNWLRRFGNQEVMLRACYERSGRATDIVGTFYELIHPVGVGQARTIFYKVTGKPFNSVPVPLAARATMSRAGVIDDELGVNTGVSDEFDLDPDIAGEVVSGVARGLSVSASAIRGKVVSEPALAVVDWRLSFTNVSDFEREARAKILLPPGAVLRRAYVIEKGKVTDAEIFPRQEARSEYRAAVSERRNPLLVSYAGPDRALVQCYPVRPRSRMEIGLELVAPLRPNPDLTGYLVLPAFEERNFPGDFETTVSIQADSPVVATNPVLTVSARRGTFEAAGKLATADLARGVWLMETSKLKQLSPWYSDPTDPETTENAQCATYLAQDDQKLSKLIVVVDGSAAMAPHMNAIRDGLRAAPAGLPVQIILVGDVDRHLCPHGTTAGARPYEEALAQLKPERCQGGQVDASALAEGVHAAWREAGTAVLWIHAAQPVDAPATASVTSRLSQVRERPLLYDLPVVSGADSILSGSAYFPGLCRVPSHNDVGQAIKDFFAAYATRRGALISDVVYRHPEGSPAGRSSYELAQLGAYETVLSEVQSKPDTALETALKYHLITPVSSAVYVEPEPPPEFKFWRARRSGGGGSDEVSGSMMQHNEPVTGRAAEMEAASPPAATAPASNAPARREFHARPKPSPLTLAKAFGMSPVPEPDTWVLMAVALGLLACLVVVRRKPVRKPC